MVIVARWWQKEKKRSQTKRKCTSECPSSIIDNSACSEVTTGPSPYDANLWRLFDESVFDDQAGSARLAKHGIGIGLQGELASSMRGGGLKHWRSSKDTQMLCGSGVDREVME